MERGNVFGAAFFVGVTVSPVVPDVTVVPLSTWIASADHLVLFIINIEHVEDN